MANPKVIVIRTAGTNCDSETASAFAQCSADVELVHVKQLLDGRRRLQDYHVLAIPGGFTYGDDIESGRILANELRIRLKDDLKKFILDGKLIIGICNGFQVLVRAGILPGPLAPQEEISFKQTATLTNNDSGKFEDRWVHLKVSGNSVWTKGMSDQVFFPVAHAEGKFITANEQVLDRIVANGQVAFSYCSVDGNEPIYPQNPNGAQRHIAGITDQTGRILGLMPHPERHFWRTQNPLWTRCDFNENEVRGEGAAIFQNGVNYVKAQFL